MDRKKVVLILMSLAFFALTSCSDKQYQVLFEKRNALPADTAGVAKAITLDKYKIQPQDVLQIRNLQDIKYIANLAPVSENTAGGNAQTGEAFQVEEDSTVKLPALGKVKVGGLSRVEAQEKIERLYGDSLLKNPIIELKITNLKVTLLGEVRVQGNYTLVKDKTTLVEMVGQAGGLTTAANEKNVKIIRGNQTNPTVINVDMGSVTSINDPRSILQSGDIIYVAQNRRAARNDNLQNFSTILQPALILFNTALIIFTLVKR